MNHRSIAWLMGIVAIVAVDLTAIRAISQPGVPGGLLLCMAVLPMANILAVGFLIGHRYRGCRRFLSGFETFGVAPLLFLIAAIVSDDVRVLSYLNIAVEPLRASLGPAAGQEWNTFHLLIARSGVALWATLPQLAFAMIGGFLSRAYRITITKWPAEIPPDE
jgi:hypothetical protein